MPEYDAAWQMIQDNFTPTDAYQHYLKAMGEKHHPDTRHRFTEAMRRRRNRTKRTN